MNGRLPSCLLLTLLKVWNRRPQENPSLRSENSHQDQAIIKQWLPIKGPWTIKDLWVLRQRSYCLCCKQVVCIWVLCVWACVYVCVFIFAERTGIYHQNLEWGCDKNNIFFKKQQWRVKLFSNWWANINLFICSLDTTEVITHTS